MDNMCIFCMRTLLHIQKKENQNKEVLIEEYIPLAKVLGHT